MRIHKYQIDKVTSGEVFLAIQYATLFILFLVFNFSLKLYHISLPFKICSSLADSGIIVSICMMLRGKWRSIAAVVPIPVGLLLLANLLYFRNFEDILQPSSYLNANIGDPAITGGALSSFIHTDLIFLTLPFCPLAYLLLKRRKVFDSHIRLRWKLIIAVSCMISWGISYVGVFRRMSLWYPDYSRKEVIETIFAKDSLTWSKAYEMHNFTGYTIKCIVSSFNIGMDLSPDDLAAIKTHVAGKSRHKQIHQPDSTDSRRPKNLIMIIVESLPFKVIEHPEAARLIPTITETIRDSSSIVSKCAVLADYGRSSDAQFIYNTGLLPLRHEALVDNYAYNDYPSLAKAMTGHSMEIIGECKNLWLHSLTTISYGFDSLIDNIAPQGMDQDSLIFKSAEKEVLDLTSPFFLFITSISMHDPYDSSKVSNGTLYDRAAADDSREREYFARLSLFDKCLGDFLSVLKKNGIYEDTVIVILGDHEIRASKISASLHDNNVPFIILNSPLKSKPEIPTTQLDVFPTVLDMMRFQRRYLGEDYYGLGRSIFTEETQGGKSYIPTEKDYEISEMIIKGRPSL